MDFMILPETTKNSIGLFMNKQLYFTATIIQVFSPKKGSTLRWHTLKFLAPIFSLETSNFEPTNTLWVVTPEH